MLSVTVTAPVWLIVELGVKVTVMVQVPLTATLAGQLLVSVKSPATVPLAAILVMVKAAAPVFCNVAFARRWRC